MGGAASIQLGCAHLGEVRHVCALFDGDDEAHRVLMPFIVDGFACREKAVHIVGSGRETDHLRRLEQAGIDVPDALARGQLDVRSNTDTYLSGGRFDADRMLAAFEAMASGNDPSGYPLSRIVCNMDWTGDSRPLFDDVLRFEARVNAVWSRHKDVVICVYDVRQMSGDMVIDIMRTHPIVLIGHVLQENPFFVPPERFLRERAEREGARGDMP